MKFVKSIRAVTLMSALIFSGSCTSDGTDPVETAEEENRVPDQLEDEPSSELPSAETASQEAQVQESVDSNTPGETQKLASYQQLPVDEAAIAAPGGAGQEIAAASTAGAEVDAQAPAESPSLPEVAPIAVAEAPAESPKLPTEAGETEASLLTIADVVADTPAPSTDAPAKATKSKKSKAHKKSSHKAAPALSGNEKIYIVQPGDTLGNISVLLYGNVGQWKSLAELNGITPKGRIFPGDAIKYSSNESSAAFESRWDGLNKASVTVERNDTLSKIAARVMGNSSYWKVLWHWNETAVADPNKIAVGQTLQYVATKDIEAAKASAPSDASAH